MRDEFKGRRLKGTAIELSNQNNTGATQVAAAEFLEITYPSGDVLKSIEAVAPDAGRPVVMIGERGQGKSHLMAVLFHAFTSAKATRKWLETWAGRMENPKIAKLALRDGMFVITESLHRQHFKFLWDLVLDRHPDGKYARGKWDSLGDKKPDIPSFDLMLELFKKHPTALILDEFQTWYDGLTNTKQQPPPRIPLADVSVPCSLTTPCTDARTSDRGGPLRPYKAGGPKRVFLPWRGSAGRGPRLRAGWICWSRPPSPRGREDFCKRRSKSAAGGGPIVRPLMMT